MTYTGNNIMKKYYSYLLKVLVWFHNYSYKSISRLSTKLNNGVHPKHEIIKYYKFFNENIEKGSKVLDVGCGIGYVSSKLAEKASIVVGIDINKKQIEIAKKKNNKSNIKYVLADIFDYDFNEHFDYVVLSNVLEHIKERKELLIKLKKISNNLLIRVPLITRSWLPVYIKNLGLEYRLDSSHIIEYTFEDFEKEMKSADLLIRNYEIQFGELWANVGNSK